MNKGQAFQQIVLDQLHTYMQKQTLEYISHTLTKTTHIARYELGNYSFIDRHLEGAMGENLCGLRTARVSNLSTVDI